MERHNTVVVGKVNNKKLKATVGNTFPRCHQQISTSNTLRFACNQSHALCKPTCYSVSQLRLRQSSEAGGFAVRIGSQTAFPQMRRRNEAIQYDPVITVVNEREENVVKQHN